MGTCVRGHDYRHHSHYDRFPALQKYFIQGLTSGAVKGSALRQRFVFLTLLVVISFVLNSCSINWTSPLTKTGENVSTIKINNIHYEKAFTHPGESLRWSVVVESTAEKAISGELVCKISYLGNSLYVLSQRVTLQSGSRDTTSNGCRHPSLRAATEWMSLWSLRMDQHQK
jgi:hypothetical protein